MSAPGNTSALQLAGQRAVTEATRLWNLDVFDPPIGSKHPRAAECCSIIAGIIDRNHWLSQPYKGNGPPQWCGMFAGDCWRAAGLDPTMLPWAWASTLRLVTWAQYRPWNEHKNPRPTGNDLRLCIKLEPGKPIAVEPREGDVLIVGDGVDQHGKPQPEGDHVTVGLSYSATRRTFNTISGNGGGMGPAWNGREGMGPSGQSREGISMCEYSIDVGRYKAMWLIRPAFGDLRAEAP